MIKTDVNPKLGVDPLRVAQLFILENFEAEDATVADEILALLRGGSFGEAKIRCDEFSRPEFGTARQYFTRKQFTALVSKIPFTGDNAARKRRAQQSFLRAEARCKRTNRKLRFYSQHRDRIPDILRVVLCRAKRKIEEILGPLTPQVENRLIGLSRPGSGVAIGTWNRFRVSAPFKYGATDLARTAACSSYAARLVEGSWPWLNLHLEIDWSELTYHVPYVEASGNRLAYVPKDARTMRTIAIEPHLNVMLQLGVHEYISAKLAKIGNSIDDQSRNQSLAARASVLSLGEGICTLDLSQASDSVSYELVRWLLPWDWFAYLDDLRCESGDGGPLGPIRYEKFSSMGNGYTFVLETLLFYALGWACNTLTNGEVISTYGDDIIISDCSALLLTETLQWCGFELNLDKSFYTGSFRESCGADWHNGARVTPQYIRKPVFRPTDVYQFLNRVDPLFRTHQLRAYLLSEVRKVSQVRYGLSLIHI